MHGISQDSTLVCLPTAQANALLETALKYEIVLQQDSLLQGQVDSLNHKCELQDSTILLLQQTITTQDSLLIEEKDIKWINYLLFLGGYLTAEVLQKL